jgi:ferredoxin-like protein FixX
MNKVVTDVESGIKRIRTQACPANCIRLNKNTPCSITGVCGECITDETLCNNIVITRRSTLKGRIKVYLIGEELGF